MVLDGDGRREWREEHGGVAGVACMAAEPPCVLFSPPLDWTHDACHGADGNTVARGVEEALDIFWVVEEGDAAVNGGVSPSLPVGGEASHWQPPFCATSPALGLDAQPLRHHLLRQRQLQSQYGYGHIAASCCSGGRVEGSPMSSISSYGSGGGLVGKTPAAMWEVDLQRRVPELKRAHDDDEIGGRQPLVSRPSTDCESLADLNQFFRRADAELRSPTTGVEEEIVKEDNIKHLLQTLMITSFEREKLLAQNSHSGFLEQSPSLPRLRPSSGSARGNEGIGRFDAQTRTDSSQSNDPPSPGESSLFEFIPSPVLFDGPAAKNPSSGIGQQHLPPERDAASETIDRLLKKKALPEKGKLLQAVIEAGPLLQTLLVAGSLPQWRNPPPLRPFQIPPVSVRGPNRSAESVHPSPRPSPPACAGGHQRGKRQKL